jgi:hypothetical protein
MALNTLYLNFRFEMDNTVVTDYKIFCDGDIMLPIGIRCYTITLSLSNSRLDNDSVVYCIEYSVGTTIRCCCAALYCC